MSVQPSQLLGLTPGSYEAYCLDQATWYLGTFITSELEKASQPKKKVKGQAATEGARRKVLAKYLDDASSSKSYADPAMLFQQ